LLTNIGLSSNRQPHANRGADERRIGLVVGMKQPWCQLAENRFQLAGLDPGDGRAPTLALFRRVRAGGRVQKGEANYAIRRAPHDLEGDLAAHGQTREREARRRIGEDSGG
jgi:hypothetical protein